MRRAWALAAMVLVVVGCDRATRVAAPAYSPNVLLITVDTLRPDALGWVAGRNATPALDGLADEGFAFAAAVTPVPLTLPAHTSLLTGRIPPRHGVRDNGQMVGADVPTLAESLKDAGYDTAAFVSGFPLQALFGLDRGFAHYDDAMPDGPQGWVERRAPETTTAAMTWLGGRTEPWFAWIHYYDPHEPYEPPRTFWKPGRRGTYDGEVEFTDNQIGKLLAAIPPDVLERTLIVMTADHGEGLGEHREHTHGYYIYESTVRVPLVFRQPGRVPIGASEKPARLVDVMPTVLELLGLEPLPDMDGVSLVPTLLGRDQQLPPTWIETQLPWRYFGWAPLSAVRLDEWKYIEAPRPELYDLANDPDEQENLLDLEDDRVAWLRDEMAQIDRTSEAETVVLDDPEVIEKLRALGYVGAGSASADAPQGLPDPKDRIDEREKLQRAEILLRANRADQAVALFDEVLALEPNNRAAMLRSGVALLKKGDLQGAAERLARAIELDPDRAEARYAFADALTRSGRLEDGAQQWMELVRLQPRRLEGWMNLGTTLRGLGRLREAADAYARALELQPENDRVAGVTAQAWFDLATADLNAGNDSSARDALGAAIRADPQIRDRATADPTLAPLLR